jgi:predicted RNA-binding Zn-ribbon protein involved in translation (DUF1610 family)
VKANPLYKKNCGAGLLRGREERRFPLRKFKGRKIDGITLRQKAEKCKILAPNCGKSNLARNYGTMICLKLGQQYRCRNLAMCTMSH